MLTRKGELAFWRISLSERVWSIWLRLKMFSFFSTFMAYSFFEPFFWTKNTFPNDPRPMTFKILKEFLLISRDEEDLEELQVDLLEE